MECAQQQKEGGIPSSCEREEKAAGASASAHRLEPDSQAADGPDEITVRFLDTEEVDDGLLRFAVIAARSAGQWVFCRHRDRETMEMPGGHREAGESILQTAERELHEATGAHSFSLKPVCVYGVTGKNRVNPTGRETFGMLFFAEVEAFESALHHEMEQMMLCREPPQRWTYPQIQSALLHEVCARLEYEFGSSGD